MSLEKREDIPSPFVVRPSGKFDGNDGNWSTFLLQAGTPPQQFRSLVSTSSFYHRLVVPGGCVSGGGIISGCPDWRGADNNVGWDDSKSSSLNRSISGSGTLEINEFLPTENFGRSPDNSSYASAATWVVDKTILRSGVDGLNDLVNNSTLITNIVQSSYFVGSIGLGSGVVDVDGPKVPSMINSLAKSSLIPSRSFGYTAGAFYRNQVGNLVLGGYDRSRVGQRTVDFKLPNSLGGTIPEVSIKDVGVTLADGTAQSAVVTPARGTNNIRAVIESTLPFLYLPRPVCDRLEQLYGLVYEDSTQLYRVNATQRAANRGKTLRITVADSSNPDKTFDVELPYEAVDLEATRFIPTYQPFGNSTSYFPLRRLPEGNAAAVLGRAYLQEAYLIVDYERSNFTIGQAIHSNQNSFSITPILSVEEGNKDGNGLSGGAIAGIVVGIVAVLLLVFALFWFLWRRKRQVKAKEVEIAVANAGEKNRRDTVQSTFSGSTALSDRPGHARHESELSADSEVGAHQRGSGIVELGGQSKPVELEDRTDTSHWIRNQERMSTQPGRFHELIGDMPPGVPDSPATGIITPAGVDSGAVSPRSLGLSRTGSSAIGASGDRRESGTVSPQSDGMSRRESDNLSRSPVSQTLRTPEMRAQSPASR